MGYESVAVVFLAVAVSVACVVMCVCVRSMLAALAGREKLMVLWSDKAMAQIDTQKDLTLARMHTDAEIAAASIRASNTVQEEAPNPMDRGDVFSVGDVTGR